MVNWIHVKLYLHRTVKLKIEDLSSLTFKALHVNWAPLSLRFATNTIVVTD